MNRTAAIFLLISISLVPSALSDSASAPARNSSSVAAPVLDINRASAEDFEKLPGIGPKLAHEIVSYRAKHGPFHRVEDLLIIPGIGSKKWKALRPRVCVGCSPGK